LHSAKSSDIANGIAKPARSGSTIAQSSSGVSSFRSQRRITAPRWEAAGLHDVYQWDVHVELVTATPAAALGDDQRARLPRDRGAATGRRVRASADSYERDCERDAFEHDGAVRGPSTTRSEGSEGPAP